MKNKKKVNNRSFLLLILFLFSTSLISLKTLQKVNNHDIRISGNELFSPSDLVNNSSLKFQKRLILIQTKFLEKELKKNLSLKNISVSRQIFPFGLKVQIKTRIPVAYGEKFINNKKVKGFIDEDGVFINKKYADTKNLKELRIQVFGWEDKFKKTLSEILNSQENYEYELVKVTFSPNGFLSIEEKDLNTILLGFKTNLIKFQLQIISKLKKDLKKNNFSEKIDIIDLTDPNKPKIKVFKP